MNHRLLTVSVLLSTGLSWTLSRASGAILGGIRRRRATARTSRGQSTAEYALVLLGAATVALVFLAWAGSTGRIGQLFDAVLDTIIGKV